MINEMSFEHYSEKSKKQNVLYVPKSKSGVKLLFKNDLPKMKK
jgi:hypothetical protein